VEVPLLWRAPWATAKRHWQAVGVIASRCYFLGRQSRMGSAVYPCIAIVGSCSLSTPRNHSVISVTVSLQFAMEIDWLFRPPSCFLPVEGQGPCLTQARREPQRHPGKHSRGAPKHFHGTLLGRKFLNFFKMVHSGVLYISGRQRGPQTSRGPG